MIKKGTLLVSVAFILCVPLLAFAAKGGKPDNLQQQIDELRLRVETLEQAPQGVKVYDADGHYLGISTEIGRSQVNIYVPSIGIHLSLDTRIGDLYPYGVLLFESSNCSGQPYYSGARWLTRLEDTYYIGENVAPITIEANSSLTYLGCDINYFSILEMIPYNEFDISQLPFTFPIALPLRFESN